LALIGITPMVTIESKFIGDFKVGDNINYNLEVLAVLYNRFNNAGPAQRRLLCKPIIILLAAIVEAALYDFHKRVKFFTIEGAANLTAERKQQLASGRTRCIHRGQEGTCRASAGKHAPCSRQ
jgi:hypothetical protein